jgi:alginate O-acetyltransferase complex protein AlgI
LLLNYFCARRGRVAPHNPYTLVFSSAVFLFYFLPVVLIIYFLFRKNIVVQNLILLFASLVFYFWGEKQYTVLVLASILFNYVMGIAIDRQKHPYKKWLLGFAVTINLLMLIYFKYLGFILQNIGGLVHDDHLADGALGMHLPLGISFFTFHGLTYVIDIYRRDANVSHNPLNTGLYTLFFPQLIAGPIIRYKDIDDQLTAREVTRQRIYIGIQRFIIGFAKKLMIANTAGMLADHIYAVEPIHMSAQMLWLAALAYSLQIYFDFSGYSDMAIGLAKICGFDFLENFNYPYSATSIRDFWRKWHISLSNFFRDYVYIPLGGNRAGKGRNYLNLFIVFFLTGFWHGASWNYLIWGMYHGAFLILERVWLYKILDRVPVLLRHLYTIFVVMVGWVFFRLEDFGLMQTVLKKMFLIDRSYQFVYSLRFYLTNYTILILLIGIVFSFPVYRLFRDKSYINTSNVALKFTYDLGFVVLFLLSLTVMASSTFNPFIYFRF